MNDPLYKLLEAKLELGSINPAALCYINLAIASIDDENTSTMRLDSTRPGSIRLFINSKWLDMVHISDLTKLIYIESSRIALQHITLRDTHTEANLTASDIICNRFSEGALMLSGCSFMDAMEASGIYKWYKEAKDLYEKDTETPWNVEDETLERLCYWMNRVNQEKNDDVDNQNEMSDSGSSQNKDNSDESSGNGSSSSKSQSSNKDNDVQSSRDKNQQAINDYFNDKERSKGWKSNEGMRERVKDVTKRLDQNGILGTSAWGNSSGGKLEKILAAAKPPVNPARVLMMFLENIRSQKTESTRRRLNRRYGLLFPGTRSLYKCRILIASDTSGSMSEYELADAISLIFSLARDAEIHFCWWDAECTEPKLLKRSDTVKHSMDVAGRGGTDPTCVFEMLADKKLTRQFSGIIFFSDMYFGKVEKPCGITNNKMLWISTQNGTNPPDWVPQNRIMKACDMAKAINKKKGIEV